MVHTDHASANRSTAEIVHGEVRAALVLVLQPPKTLALAGLMVACELEEDGLAVLRENSDDIALRELVGEAAKVDVGCVAVIDVPGGVGGAVEGVEWVSRSGTLGAWP